MLSSPGRLPVTVIVLLSVAAPGQYSVYVPAATLTAKLPLNPGGRFSFSPRMRAPLRTSTSLTAVASLLVTLTVIPPAANWVLSGTQPLAAVIVTVAVGVARGGFVVRS